VALFSVLSSAVWDVASTPMMRRRVSFVFAAPPPSFGASPSRSSSVVPVTKVRHPIPRGEFRGERNTFSAVAVAVEDDCWGEGL